MMVRSHGQLEPAAGREALGVNPKSMAGTYTVWYRRGIENQRTAKLTVGCDGSFRHDNNAVNDRINTGNVRGQCPRDPHAQFFILNTYGAGKFECLRQSGANIIGTHFLADRTLYGTIEYTRASTNHNCNQCKCPHGTVASGASCNRDGATICSACNAGFYKQGTSCAPNVCKCPHGTAPTGASCNNNGATICKSCKAGFHGSSCIPNACTCEHGTAATGAACKHGARSCAACKDGRHLNETACMLNICTCENGDVGLSL